MTTNTEDLPEVQDDVKRPATEAERRAQHRKYLLENANPHDGSGQMLTMDLDSNLNSLKAMTEVLSHYGATPDEVNCYLTVAERAVSDISTVLELMRKDKNDPEWIGRRVDPVDAERIAAATFRKWFEDHCNVSRYDNGHNANPLGYLVCDMTYLSEDGWPDFKTKEEFVAWACKVENYGRRRYNDTTEATAAAGYLWFKFQRWINEGAPDKAELERLEIMCEEFQ